MKKQLNTRTIWALPLATMITLPASAQLVVSDTLTGASSTYPWSTTGGACLTAGDNSGTIPACTALPYYSGKTLVGGVTGRLPDPVGQGALRLTNGDTTTGSNGNNNTGSVISQNPFPTNQGVQVTFSTVTYGGNAYTNGAGIKSGADGIAFFLMDGTKPPSVGAFGGSLGYSCSQNKNPARGVDGGYLAVAIDEFGNFSNPGDDTATGPGVRPGYIVVRGSGSITYPALNLLNSTLYPSSLAASSQNTAVQHTCGTGLLQDWHGGSDHGNALAGGSTIPVRDYNHITSQKVSVPIFNQEATNFPLRGNANVLTYQLSITQDGLLSLSYSANGGAITQVLNKMSITAGNGPLPPSFRFGFTSGTGGGSNVHEITCFKAAPLNLASDSAATNVQQSSKVQIGSQVYFAFYHPLNSWGELSAKSLLADASGNLSIATSANWDASCVLTGGPCPNTGTPTTAEAPGARKIISWNDANSTGVGLQLSNLSPTQQTAIGGTTDGATRINYLRGDRTNEITSPGVGVFRKRDGVLGDIVNSSPTWVGGPAASYGTAGNDLIKNTNIAEFGASYTSFATTYQNRTNIVYVGANDGLLHGFRSNSPVNDGNEMLAYMPSSVVNTIHSSNTALDFSSPEYGHNSFVDATPGVGDLYYNGAWHTWLAGGLGAGGNANGTINDNTTVANGTLYALDITDPSNFSESSAGNIAIGEWNSSNLTCSNVATCKDSLGSVYGTPIIRLLHDGNWAVIFGNGRNSKTGTAGVFIMSIDKATGTKTFRFLDTGKKSTTNMNGLDFVVSADLDGDHVTDYLYGGDSQGNLWRFDLTNADPGQWAADTNPIFSTPGAQPISTAPTVSAVYGVTGLPRIIINFATGRQSPQTLTSAQTFANGTQSIYGIWDSNLNAWNAISKVKYNALPPGQSFDASNLVAQTITTYSTISGSISGYRTVTQNTVCWKGSTTPGCAADTQFGWKMDLPGVNEQVVYSPVILDGTLFVNTTIPGINQTLSCTSQPASGFTMGLSADAGTAPVSNFVNTGLPTTTPIAGVGLSWFGTPALVSTGKKSYLIGNTSGAGMAGGGPGGPGGPCPGPNCLQKQSRKNGTGGRLTWVKLR